MPLSGKSGEMGSADGYRQAEYVVVVSATDKFLASSSPVSITYTLTVTDLNGNAPVYSGGAVGSVDENAAESTVIFRAVTTDADGTEANGDVVYSLSGADVALLDIDSVTGKVCLKARADN